MKKKEPEKNSKIFPATLAANKQKELDQKLNRERGKKIAIVGAVLGLIIVIVAAGYFVLLKPHNDAMNLVKKSETLIAQGNYTEALKNIAWAKIRSPKMKGLNYRGGLIQLLQMDYYGAEDLFKKEIAEDGHVAGAELALGFLYTVDAMIHDNEIPVHAKAKIIEELSSAIQIDISLARDLKSLNLSSDGTYFNAITHFAKSRDANSDFTQAASVGLAFAHALDGNRDAGLKSFSAVSNLKTMLPVLTAFYDGIEPKLGVSPDLVAGADIAETEGETADTETPLPAIPVDELPEIPEDLDIKPLPSHGSVTDINRPPWHAVKSFKPKPTVKPFKISEYVGKEGDVKHTVTLLNIYDSGRTVAREGQTRKMPKSEVEVTVQKLSEDEIILRENNLHTFKWHRTRNTWYVVETDGKPVEADEVEEGV